MPCGSAPESVSAVPLGADVAFGLSIKRADLTAEEVMNRVRAALAAVNLKGDEWLDKQVATLSGGQKQRVAIARALVGNPDLILADEPTGNLDTKMSREIMEVLSALNEQDGMTIIMVTNLVQQAERLANRTAFFLGGECVEVGDTADLFAGKVEDERTRDYIEGKFG